MLWKNYSTNFLNSYKNTSSNHKNRQIRASVKYLHAFAIIFVLLLTARKPKSMTQQAHYYIEHSTNRHKLGGFLVSFSIHAIILLGLYFISLYPPNPPLGSIGMEMSLGEENAGGPDPSPVPDPQPNETYTPISEQTDEPDELSQQTDNDVPVTAKENPKTKPKEVKPVQSVTPKLELPKKVDATQLFRSNKNAGQNNNSGDGTAPGQQGGADGVPGGDPNGKGGSGGPGSGGTGGYGGNNGSGSSFDIEGRKVLFKPKITDDSKGVGVVFVSIVVNRDGRVTQAVPGQRGSTTIDMHKLEKAKQIALQVRYSAREDGPDEQHGMIKINFSY